MLQNASSRLKAAVFGLGLLTAVQLQAQTTTSSSTSGQVTSSQLAPSGTTSRPIQDATILDAQSAILGAGLSTPGGLYGNITDIIFDGTGRAQYVLVANRGQLHPVPFSLLQFGANGELSVGVSATALDAVTIDRNNLQALNSPEFGTRLRAALGPAASRSFFNPAGVVPGTGNGNANPDSTAGQRAQLFSLTEVMRGNISIQGGDAGRISAVGLLPNGQIAFAIGTSGVDNQRFAFPLTAATINSSGSGVSLNVSSSALNSMVLPSGTLPSLTDTAFVNSFRSIFGDNALNFPQTGTFAQLGTTSRANNPLADDPVSQAGNRSQSGANAVASAGDRSRGGFDAVARPGDRLTSTGTGVDPTAARGMQAGQFTGRDITGPGGTNVAPPTTGTGGIVNAAPEVASAPSLGGQDGLIQLRDLLNFRIQAADGAFGRVSDIVFDRNGNVQYVLGSFQGQTFALPFMAGSFSSTTPNTLQFNVPAATLQQLAINPDNLPSLNNQAFVQRMQQVFGNSFGVGFNENVSGYAPAGRTVVTGSGVTNAGSGVRGPGGSVLPGPTPFSKNRLSTGTGATGTGGSAGMTGINTGVNNQDSWTWPTTGPGSGVRGPGGGVLPGPTPFSKNRPVPGTGTTDAGSGVRGPGGSVLPGPTPFSKNRLGPGSGTTGTGGRIDNTSPRGTGTGGTTGGSGATGGAGSGTTGATSGGSGSTGGSGGSGS